MAELVAYVESSEYFVFSGYKHSQICLLPLMTDTITMTLLPIAVGRCNLPRIKIAKKSDAIFNADGKIELSDEKLFNIPTTTLRRENQLSVHVAPNCDW